MSLASMPFLPSFVAVPMPILKLAWAFLTMVMTIAIYLHKRRLPAGDTHSELASSPFEEVVSLDETEESNSEIASTSEQFTRLGAIVAYLVKIYAHMVPAPTSASEITTPPGEAVAFPLNKDKAVTPPSLEEVASVNEIEELNGERAPSNEAIAGAIVVCSMIIIAYLL